MLIGITITRQPPMSAGTTYELMAMANTSNEPASTPGMLSGNVMLQKVFQRVPPRLRAASSSTGSILRMMPMSDSTMNGSDSCTSPTTVPNALYISGMG